MNDSRKYNNSNGMPPCVITVNIMHATSATLSLMARQYIAGNRFQSLPIWGWVFWGRPWSDEVHFSGSPTKKNLSSSSSLLLRQLWSVEFPKAIFHFISGGEYWSKRFCFIHLSLFGLLMIVWQVMTVTHPMLVILWWLPDLWHPLDKWWGAPKLKPPTPPPPQQKSRLPAFIYSQM